MCVCVCLHENIVETKIKVGVLKNNNNEQKNPKTNKLNYILANGKKKTEKHNNSVNFMQGVGEKNNGVLN